MRMRPIDGVSRASDYTGLFDLVKLWIAERVNERDSGVIFDTGTIVMNISTCRVIKGQNYRF